MIKVFLLVVVETIKNTNAPLKLKRRKSKLGKWA